MLIAFCFIFISCFNILFPCFFINLSPCFFHFLSSFTSHSQVLLLLTRRMNVSVCKLTCRCVFAMLVIYTIEPKGYLLLLHFACCWLTIPNTLHSAIILLNC